MENWPTAIAWIGRAAGRQHFLGSYQIGQIDFQYPTKQDLKTALDAVFNLSLDIEVIPSQINEDGSWEVIDVSGP